MIPQQEYWCEFIEINDKGEFRAAFPESKAHRRSCRRLAVYTYRFANYTGHFCKRHYAALQEWALGDGQ
jgi:hypothetical protein